MHLLSVGQLTHYLKELVETDEVLQDVWVYGEVSNLSRSPSGHLYFTLKEASAQTKCVMFKSALGRGAFVPAHGMLVVCHGRVSIYEQQGSLQLYVDVVQPEGVGELQLEFERLRAQLEAEGLFDLGRKRPLPLFPRRIGVVTSPTSAAFQDILHVLGRRYPLAEVVLAPTLVQGPQAAPQIARAIGLLGEFGELDVLIVARGGGSMEELWPFNEEIVARAVFAAPMPVISGVGHETDFTICDLVADRRAPTPSVAAELAVPDQRELWSQVEAMREELALRCSHTLNTAWQNVDLAAAALQRASPLRLIRERAEDVVGRRLRLGETVGHRLAIEGERVHGLLGQLHVLDPHDVLKRGFALVEDGATGEPVRRAATVAAGDALRIHLVDGAFGAVALGDSPDGAARARTAGVPPAVPLKRLKPAGETPAVPGSGRVRRARAQGETAGHQQLRLGDGWGG